jgi:uncharacterized protein with GYD domain
MRLGLISAPEKRRIMPKYLAKATYMVGAGVKGLAIDGGSARVKAVTAMVESLGGTVESFYFAFGDVDAYTVFEVPTAAAAAAVSLAAAATGLADVDIVPLLTPEEVDAAAKLVPSYDAPGPSA